MTWWVSFLIIYPIRCRLSNAEVQKAIIKNAGLLLWFISLSSSRRVSLGLPFSGRTICTSASQNTIEHTFQIGTDCALRVVIWLVAYGMADVANIAWVLQLCSIGILPSTVLCNCCRGCNLWYLV